MEIGAGINIEGGMSVFDTTPIGQIEYTTPGTYTWIAPPGVTSVSVVCVGGDRRLCGCGAGAAAAGNLAEATGHRGRLGDERHLLLQDL